MPSPTHPINIQLKALIDNGLSAEEAAQCLGLDVDAVQLSLDMRKNKILDADDLIEKNRARCIQALIDIGLNTDGDYNVGVRVQALKVVVERKGMMSELPVDKLSETYKRMKEVCAGYNKIQPLDGKTLIGDTTTESLSIVR